MITAKTDVAIFFAFCVFIAGCYGAYSTGKPRIFFVQSILAILALISLFI